MSRNKSRTCISEEEKAVVGFMGKIEALTTNRSLSLEAIENSGYSQFEKTKMRKIYEISKGEDVSYADVFQFLLIGGCTFDWED